MVFLMGFVAVSLPFFTGLVRLALLPALRCAAPTTWPADARSPGRRPRRLAPAVPTPCMPCTLAQVAALCYAPIVFLLPLVLHWAAHRKQLGAWRRAGLAALFAFFAAACLAAAGGSAWPWMWAIGSSTPFDVVLLCERAARKRACGRRRGGRAMTW